MIKKYYLPVLFLVFFIGCKPQIGQDEAVILEARSGAGMFSVLDDVWSVLDCYDRNICSAVKVDFGTTGEYYDQKKGPNWFDYYFLPVNLGTPKKPFIKTNHPFENGTTHPEYHEMSREKVGYLMHKYVKVRPEIAKKIQEFTDLHFKHEFIIGIHYRGTDKSSEAPRTKYEKVFEEIKKQAVLKNLSHYKIFVATDEQAFIDHISLEFPHQVVYLPEVKRSKDGKPLHLGKQQGQYESGLDALMDCLVLSKTNLLIRTSSNLSRWSAYFNPNLPVIELSKRH